MYSNLNGIQLGQAIGKDRRTVSRWTRAGLPRNPDKSYDLPRVIEWLLNRERDALVDQTGGDSPELERWRRIRADLAALELKQRQGELVSVDDVLAAWCNRHSMVRDALLSLVDRLPPMVVGLDQLEIRERIERETDHILDCFSKEGRFTPRQSEGL